MNSFVLTINLALIAVACAGSVDFHPLSDEAIALINSKQSTWTAGKNFDISEWDKVRKIASGVVKNPSIPTLKVVVHDDDVEIPEEFDAREQWPDCPTIQQIRDQSNCRSSWAFGAVEAMSDRICIHSGGKTIKYVSAEDVISCCSTACGDGCNGADAVGAWIYWMRTGIVTGGLYNSTDEGCRAYSLPPCEHYVSTGSRPTCNDFDGSAVLDTPTCVKQCDEATSLVYDEDVTYGGEPYRVLRNETQIQLEIMTNGPVEAEITVYEDFPTYKSGVYQATTYNFLGTHAIKLLGWGVENGVDYWLAANSWNEDWGLNGYFKILRGENHCGIADDVHMSIPVLD